MKTPAERTEWFCACAREAGFDLCGVAPPGGSAELDKFSEWLARGYAGEMHYLEDSRRRDPQLALPGARSVIVTALNYNSPHPYSTPRDDAGKDEAPRGWISRYTWGDDYHYVLKRKLDNLVAELRQKCGEAFEARSYVDTGPILERVAAKYAGLGWLGKNTCLINQRLGSWLFLGVILTTLELAPTLASSAAPPPDLCGSCTRCLDACPTRAFPEPYVLDARRCISYLTIELRGGSIPEELRGAMGDALLGCDICQDVCPWNRKAPLTDALAFQPRSFAPNDGNQGESSLFNPSLDWAASLSPHEFSTIFRKSAAKRAKWRGMVRNACVAIGNSSLTANSEKHRQTVAILKKLAASDDALISEHANWALERLSATRASSGPQ